MSPLYVYETPDGVQYERLFPIGKAPKTLTARTDPERSIRKGVRATRVLAVHRQRAITGSWPILSNAMGVALGQQKKIQRMFGEHHRFAPDARAIFESAEHRKRCLKDRGAFDRDAYY